MYGHAAVHRDRVKNSVSVIVARQKKGRHEWHVEEDEDEHQQQRVTGKSNNCINLFSYGSAVIRCRTRENMGGGTYSGSISNEFLLTFFAPNIIRLVAAFTFILTIELADHAAAPPPAAAAI